MIEWIKKAVQCTVIRSRRRRRLDEPVVEITLTVKGCILSEETYVRRDCLTFTVTSALEVPDDTCAL